MNYKMNLLNHLFVFLFIGSILSESTNYLACPRITFKDPLDIFSKHGQRAIITSIELILIGVKIDKSDESIMTQMKMKFPKNKNKIVKLPENKRLDLLLTNSHSYNGNYSSRLFFYFENLESWESINRQIFSKFYFPSTFRKDFFSSTDSRFEAQQKERIEKSISDYVYEKADLKDGNRVISCMTHKGDILNRQISLKVTFFQKKLIGAILKDEPNMRNETPTDSKKDRFII